MRARGARAARGPGRDEPAEAGPMLPLSERLQTLALLLRPATLRPPEEGRVEDKKGHDCKQQ
jgi:hypothetical protein